MSCVRRILDVFRSERGASLVEYALIAALIAVVAIGALTLLGGNIQNKLRNVANAIGG
ncbi:MAG: Flp family type IVb pilin [Bacillota bacterium]